jgi:hypothetical protein
MKHMPDTCIVLQALSESMYDLAHTGAQRVAKLCREPSGLACWALELLEEQACLVRPVLPSRSSVSIGFMVSSSPLASTQSTLPGRSQANAYLQEF